MLDWLGRFHNLRVEELARCAYHYHDNDAARHLMRVAVGLDSMVLGEPQILGQLKDAYQQARQAKGLGGELERLFQHTFAVAKQVRTETGIGVTIAKRDATTAAMRRAASHNPITGAAVRQRAASTPVSSKHATT